MTFLRNMKIRGKLFTGFFLLLAITVIIAAFGAINIMSVNNDYSYVLEYPVERRSTLRDIEVAMMDARRIMNRASMYASEVAGDGSDAAANERVRNEGIDGQERLLAQRRADLDGYFINFRESLSGDPFISEENRNMQLNRMENMRSQVMHYIDHYIAMTMGFARQGDSVSTIEVTRGAVATVNVIYAHFGEVFDFIEDYMATINQDLNAVTEQTFTIMIILTVAGLVLGVFIAMLISNMIVKPVQRVSDMVNDVADGKLNINVDRSLLSKDEVGVLAEDIYRLVDVIRSMVDDLIKLDHEYNTNGDIDARIDVTNYHNTFREMVEGVNHIPNNILDDIMTILNALSDINKGNFDISVKDLPGKKMVLPETVRATVANLQAVNAEINEMIVAAADKGNLEFHINDSKYEGGWKEIMRGLNHIAEAVDAPIVEVRDVMANLSRGDFDIKVSGDYAGDFMQIKDAVNNTMEIMESYIREMSDVLAAIASGDLTQKITRDYVGNFAEIKDSINNIAQTLRKAINDIASASENVLMGSQQIMTSATDLATGSNAQAASLEELNSSVEVINLQTQQFAENAKEANTLSTRSSDNAQKGNEAMQQMLQAMTQIKDSSSNISRIIKTIQDIAFQTNLLSLNASVEAARAGEHGRGFSVVAEEVRNLAARSQTAAAESTTLIEDSISRVETGADIAQVTSESLNTLVENATEVLSLINNISTASTEQADMVAQVSQVLLHTANTVQSNSAFSEESAAAAQELNSQAEMLKQLVAYFRI